MTANGKQTVETTPPMPPFLSLACLAVHSGLVGMSFESALQQFRALGTLVSAMPLCNAFLPNHVLNQAQAD